MKSKVRIGIVKKVRPYPKLMIGDSGIIVLFHSSFSGTVLHEGDDDGYRLGEYRNDFDYGGFKDFFGTIELEEKRYEN